MGRVSLGEVAAFFEVESQVVKSWRPERRVEYRDDGLDVYESRRFRKTPKHIGTLDVTPDGDHDRVGWIKTRRGYRRQGLGSLMLELQEERSGRRVAHSEDLTRLGAKFASGSKVVKAWRKPRLSRSQVWRASKASGLGGGAMASPGQMRQAEAMRKLRRARAEALRDARRKKR